MRKEVRRGDTISPKLFTACLEGVFGKIGWKNTGLKIKGEKLSDLRFACDIVLVRDTAEHLQKMVQLQGRGARNGNKSKVMRNTHAESIHFSSAKMDGRTKRRAVKILQRIGMVQHTASRLLKIIGFICLYQKLHSSVSCSLIPDLACHPGAFAPGMVAWH